jgi:predicted MFS family arabinose efflux permease
LDVSEDIKEYREEAESSSGSGSGSGSGESEDVSVIQLFTTKELAMPLFICLVIQLTQQLCGINAVFFYSEDIFRRAGIEDEHIQYAVFLTGFINVLATIVCVPLIDKLGRKPLLLFPMLVIIADFILMTVFLHLQTKGMIYSYLSIVCIIIFIICFAVGLGNSSFFFFFFCLK